MRRAPESAPLSGLTPGAALFSGLAFRAVTTLVDDSTALGADAVGEAGGASPEVVGLVVDPVALGTLE